MICAGGAVTLNEGRPVTVIRVVNAGDRPVQVGSHFHFAEANVALDFDRAAARGRRLAVPAGTGIRFEPGAGLDVGLVAMAGARIAAGFRGEVGGPLDEPESRSRDDVPGGGATAEGAGDNGAGNRSHG